MSHYSFYYDETEHSRTINQKTITAGNFYDGFVSVIVGWPDESDWSLTTKYLSFEETFAHRKSNGELKSTTLKQNQFRYGFASLNKENIELINLFLSLFDGILLYASVTSKLEFLVRQLFGQIQNSVIVDADAAKYTITKALLTYKPNSVISSIYDNPKDAIPLLRDFFAQRIELNKKSMPLKARENEAFRQVLLLLNDAQEISSLEWNYSVPFIGFKQFLVEMDVHDYSLTIDNEHKTYEAAESIGIQNLSEGDSKRNVGIRMADMFAGIIAKLMKALSTALTPKPNEEHKKTILPKEWFVLNEKQLSLYKKLKEVFVDQNNCWYKVYAGNYSDDLVSLIALLDFMDSFKTCSEIQQDIDKRSEQFNAFACDCLNKHYQRMANKLPIDPVSFEEKAQGYFYNRQGAKVFFNHNKQPTLPISEGGSKYTVLSVGQDNDGVPFVTVEFGGKPTCFRLPDELSGWTNMLVTFASKGNNLLPSEVIFTNCNGKYYADIM